MHLADLEKQIENKIRELEREKTRLKDDLVVIRQASGIASNFEGQHSSSERGQGEPTEEPQAKESW